MSYNAFRTRRWRGKMKEGDDVAESRSVTDSGVDRGFFIHAKLGN